MAEELIQDLFSDIWRRRETPEAPLVCLLIWAALKPVAHIMGLHFTANHPVANTIESILK